MTRYHIYPAEKLPPEWVAAWSAIATDDVRFHSPFFAPEYALAIASIRPNVHVATQLDNGQPVAFLPFELGRFGIAKKLFLADYDGLVHRVAGDLDAARFLRKCGLRAWEFKFLRSPDIPVKGGRIQEYSTIEVGCGFEAYVRARRESGTEQIKKTRNLERKLEREIGPLRFEEQVVSEPLLRQLLEWKNLKYGGSHRPAEMTTAALLKLMATQSAGCSGMLSVLHAGDSIVAMHFGLRSPTVWHYWHPAFNSEFAKYSPGIILLLKIVEHAPNLGIVTVDLGVGADYGYKVRLRTGTGRVTGGSIVVSPILAAFRMMRESAKCLLGRQARRA